MNVFNYFMRSSGFSPILYHKYIIDERKLFEYALFLRGYMRDAQHVLKDLQQHHAMDKNLVKLFEASSEYVVACNGKIGDKRTFDNTVQYRTWKIDLSKGLEKASYEPSKKTNESRHNLYLFMPFRLKDDEKTLSKWMYKNLRQSMDNKQIFADNVDTYVVFYPIQKSRSSNITSLLKTLRGSESFYEPEDMQFVKQNWLNFVADDVKFDGNKIISAKTYPTDILNENFKNITVFSYCAGTANAHRSLNALYELTADIYGEQTATTAMKNVCVISYGFLPPQEKLRYSGVHFYTNAINDKNKKEPFVNLNNHTLYERTKCVSKDTPARISVMPDKQNYVVALKLTEKHIYFRNGVTEEFKDGEHGHNLTNINTPDLNAHEGYAHQIFRSALENGSMGKRGQDILQTTTSTPNVRLLNSAILGNRQYL